MEVEEILKGYNIVKGLSNSDLIITSSPDILNELPFENRYILFVGPKDSDLILKALNKGVYKYLLFDEIDRLKECVEEIKTQFFIKKAKEYNVFMLHQYKNAIDSSNIVSKTDKKGIITYVNEEFCKISGYSRSELLGKNHNIVRHPDVPKEHFESFWRTILDKKIWKGTVKNRARDGSTFYVNTTVIPIIDYKEDIVEFVAIRYDVTKNIELQQRLQKNERELEQLNITLEKKVREQTKELRELNLNLEKRVEIEVKKNREKERLMFQQAKLASLGEMLGNIAHQWRQPLMELSILLYKMKKTHGLDEVYQKGNNIIERMNQTIIDFQNFFNPDKKKERFNVAQTINQTLSIIEGSIKKNRIEIELMLDESIYFTGFKNELSQVILNLVNNAKEIFIQRGCKHRVIKIELFKKSEKILIRVIDSAGGIEENIMERIFDPYFTTKKGGTGLGLYMSKMIIHNSMSGILSVSNTDSGAVFEIELEEENV